MSSLHSMKKEIAKRTLMFEPEMYNNMWGSLVICAYILSPDNEKTPFEINKQWHKLKKNPKLVEFGLDDPDFIEKTLKLFGIERPENFPIAMVQSSFNVLFMPYVNGQLFPLREDGVYPMTASKGKIYPIDFTNKDGEVATKSEVETECQEAENQGQTQARQRKPARPRKQ
jgi:hypothetical protein